MANSFLSFLNTADSSVSSLYGDTATYTPAGGEATSITVIMGDVTVEEETDDVGRCFFYECEAIIFKSDIATPSAAINGTLTVGSDTWQIAGIVSEDETAANYRIDRRDDKRRHRENKYIR